MTGVVTVGLLVGCSSSKINEYSQVSYCVIHCTEDCPDHKYPDSCDGCKSQAELHSHFWENCTIRTCATEKQAITCAHCDGYPECDDPMWARYPMLERNINKIRNDLEG